MYVGGFSVWFGLVFQIKKPGHYPVGKLEPLKILSQEERSKLEFWYMMREMAPHQSQICGIFLNQSLSTWMGITITGKDFQGICPLWEVVKFTS